MIRVTASSHYLETVTEAAPPAALDDALAASCREVPRRVDRFIQLALLGSARCAAGQTLQADCAVYLGSGLGPLGNTIVTQEQLLRGHELPKPFNFINTLGASAGYYIARNLGLNGQNWFVSRRGMNLDAVLETAWQDLTTGRITQALVGCVEEAPWPPAQHRRRLGLPDEARLAEGSHWLLLERDASTGRVVQEQRYANFSTLEIALEDAVREGDELWCAANLPASAVEALRRRFAVTSEECGHDSPAAAWLTQRLDASFKGTLRIVSGNDASGWGVWSFGAETV
ncbi:MAG TPA: hypothetical protein VFM15_09455 [Gammaproteobacteria bacterium]|nr:hypothetical protein [Gammaproteobacteria bacterium]